MKRMSPGRAKRLISSLVRRSASDRPSPGSISIEVNHSEGCAVLAIHDRSGTSGDWYGVTITPECWNELRTKLTTLPELRDPARAYMQPRPRPNHPLEAVLAAVADEIAAARFTAWHSPEAAPIQWLHLDRIERLLDDVRHVLPPRIARDRAGNQLLITSGDGRAA